MGARPIVDSVPEVIIVPIIMHTQLQRLPYLLTVLAWTFSGCSHTYPVTFMGNPLGGDTVTVGTFNRRLADRHVTIIR